MSSKKRAKTSETSKNNIFLNGRVNNSKKVNSVIKNSSEETDNTSESEVLAVTKLNSLNESRKKNNDFSGSETNISVVKKRSRKCLKTDNSGSLITTLIQGDKNNCEPSSILSAKNDAVNEKVSSSGVSEQLLQSTKSATTLRRSKKKLKLSNTISNVDRKSDIEHICSEDSTNEKKKNSTDFFQVMMESRKKSIGMNSPGKEIVHEVDAKEISLQKELKAKRSLTLSKWADQKGASKRKQIEEIHEQHVKNVLNKRAKTFKSMLFKNDKNNKHSKDKKLDDSSVINVDDSSNDIEKNSQSNNRQKSKKRFLDEVDDLLPKNTKLRTSHTHSPPAEKPSSLNSTSKSKKLSSSEDFLACLSPTIKKTESVLTYFAKKEVITKKNEEDLVEVLVYDDCASEENNGECEVIKVKLKPKSPFLKKHKNIKGRRKLKLKRLHKMNNAREEESKILKEKEVDKDAKIINEDVQREIITIKDQNDAITSVIVESLRPKRNIKKPAKYTQDSTDVSVSDSEDCEIFSKDKNKLGHKRKKKKINGSKNKENIDEKLVSPIKIVNLQSPGTMKCVSSPRTISLLKRDSAMNDKLAPLFKRCLPKPIVDKSVIEARRLFLQSGAPDSIKIQFDKVTFASDSRNVFPSNSHVQQIPADGHAEYYIWNLPTISHFTDVKKLAQNSERFHNISDFSLKPFVNITSVIDIPYKDCNAMFNELESSNYKQGLKKIKETHPHFPAYRTFRQLWEKFTNVPKINAVDMINNIKKSPSESELIANDSVWTEKYKPLASHDIIGNFRSVNSLKKWLESWKEYNELATTKTFKRSRRNSDSSSDFLTSDSESQDSVRVPNNTMVIIGPAGSGKTSGVYAIASELAINVLEVNASSKRTGRKILTELLEATQSHKVLTKMNSDSSMKSFFGSFDKTDDENKSNGKLNKFIQMSDKRIKSIIPKVTKSASSSSLGEASSQKSADSNVMSLILIDDADIVFDEDDGFVGALSQLVQFSKRPVVIIATDLNCGHLQRFLSVGNTIKFDPLSGKILGPWLDVLVLIECHKIIPNLSKILLEVNRGDIRSAILQLQYWIMGTKRLNTDGAITTIQPHELDAKDESTVRLSDGWSDDSCSVWPNNIVNKNPETDSANSEVTKSISSRCSIEDRLLVELLQSFKMEYSLLNISTLVVPYLSCAEEKLSNQVTLENTLELFDNLSSVATLRSCGVTYVDLPWHNQLKDSLADSENLTSFKNYEDISISLSQYMMDHSSHRAKQIFNLNCDQTKFKYMDALDIRKQHKKNAMHHQFSEAISLGAMLDRASVSLDYMAALRTMCRSEKVRSQCNVKRNNRFLHYLQSLSVEGKDNIFNKACNVLDFDSS